MARGRPRKGSTSTKKKKNNRPDGISTKEELINYLESNPEEEYPFNIKLWEKAVERAEIESQQETPTKVIITKDTNGNEVKKTIPQGTVTSNPVKQYWKLLNLPQYTKQGKQLWMEKYGIEEYHSETAKEIQEITFEDTSSDGEYNDIQAWIMTFSNLNERRFLQQKYASYYDNYEINDGADKTLLQVILGYDIELYRMLRATAEGKIVDSREKNNIVKSLRETLEAMKWTRKQRSAKDEVAQNRFTVMMDRMCKNGVFEADENAYDKDEIDFLLENIPLYMEAMDFRNGV